jgi:ribose transport system permease protein
MTGSQRLKNVLQDSSFPSVIMLVLLIIVNAILQPGFFSYQTFRMNFMTFTPLILVSLAQATLLLVGAVDLSLGAGISLVTAVMASLMGNSVGSIVLISLLGIAVAIVLSLWNGAFIAYIGPPPLILTFATSTVWFGIALVLMPSPGGHIPEAYYTLYGKSLGGFPPCP